jgi:hypothetical protein
MNRVRASASAHCELLFELFSGARGKLFVGRLLRGQDSGRIVTLREVSQIGADLPGAVDAARSLAHPRLAKVLGLAQVDGTKFVASEYMPGAALCELSAASRQQGRPIQPAVAVQILSEGLKSLALAQQLLRTHTGVGYTRSLHADTVWVAEYGDVLVTEVGLATFLGQAGPTFSEQEAASRDVVGGAVELFQLLTARALTVEQSVRVADWVPAPLASVLLRAFTAPDTFKGPQGLADALCALPLTFRASEDAVAGELRRLLGTTLEKRKQTLRALQEEAAPDGDESTQRFRTADLLGVGLRREGRPQAAPQGIPLESPPRLGAGAHEEPDEPTLVFRAQPAMPSSKPSLASSAVASTDFTAPPARAEPEDDRTLVDLPAFASLAQAYDADEPASTADDGDDVDPAIFRPARARVLVVASVIFALSLAIVVGVWLQPGWLPELLRR